MTDRVSTIRDRLLPWTSSAMVVLAMGALFSLISEHGFYLSPGQLQIAHTVNSVVLYGFLILVLSRPFLTPHPLPALRRRWFEVSVALLLLVHVIIPEALGQVLRLTGISWSPEDIAQVYLIVTQSVLVIGFLPGMIRYSQRIMALEIQPALMILGSFLVLILCGSGLLLLPKATTGQAISLLDILFTATSAVCVTGLTVVNISTHFTPLGQVFLLVLIQIGGLGIMTLTTLFAFAGGGATRLKEYATLRSIVGEESIAGVKKTIVAIGVSTLVFEALGAGVIYVMVNGKTGSIAAEPLFFAIFHSVSAFCNAGFSTLPAGLAEPDVSGNTGLLTTLMALIIVGGIGFPVLANLASVASARLRKIGRQQLNLHSKITLATSATLIVTGACAIFVLEPRGVVPGMSIGERALQAAFHSVSARTAGFSTISGDDWSLPAAFVLILLMMIGASPASTGGGIKTTALAVGLLSLRSIVTGRSSVEVFRRAIDNVTIVRAMSTMLLAGLVIGSGMFALLLTEDAPFAALLFETVSAVGTVGLSLDLTPTLSPAGKVVVIVLMLAGRVGLLSFILALTRRKPEARFAYSEERVLIT